MTSGDPMMVQGDLKQYVSERPPELRVRLGGNQTPDVGHAQACTACLALS